MLQLTPMGRLGRPEQIAAGLAYLASDDAAFVTGLKLTSTAVTSPGKAL
jgi:NAD(P)-dependent dehydrogenase (short-subunit alcohol dehydrogenase family)